jgi:hypothetical protein
MPIKVYGTFIKGDMLQHLICRESCPHLHEPLKTVNVLEIRDVEATTQVCFRPREPAACGVAPHPRFGINTARLVQRPFDPSQLQRGNLRYLVDCRRPLIPDAECPFLAWIL